VPETAYVKLTRFRRRRGSFFEVAGAYCGLWLGSDHLLSISSNRFAEQYKRFYFRDIQAFTILRTTRRRIWNFVFALLLLLFGASSAYDDSLWLWAFGIVLFFLLLNNVLGPTCTVYIQTAVQTEELPSLSRVRRANDLLDRVRPLISAVQGELGAAETAARLNEVFSGHHTSPGAGPLNLFS
jgi:hypothetical protein